MNNGVVGLELHEAEKLMTENFIFGSPFNRTKPLNRTKPAEPKGVTTPLNLFYFS